MLLGFRYLLLLVIVFYLLSALLSRSRERKLIEAAYPTRVHQADHQFGHVVRDRSRLI